MRGTTRVTVPAGTFEVVEVGFSGGQGSERAYFTVDRPRVLVRLETTGSPVAVELVEIPGG